MEALYGKLETSYFIIKLSYFKYECHFYKGERFDHIINHLGQVEQYINFAILFCNCKVLYCNCGLYIYRIQYKHHQQRHGIKCNGSSFTTRCIKVWKLDELYGQRSNRNWRIHIHNSRFQFWDVTGLCEL